MAQTDAQLRQTPLTAWHKRHGARMIPFAGYEMPVQYPDGVLVEHAAVREGVGVFDITHMGEIAVRGAQGDRWLDGLVTNRVVDIPIGKVVYTAMCNPHGGVLDDMLVYRKAEASWLVVCNAVNRDRIVTWMSRQRPPAGVEIEDESDRTALIAVQGPASLDLVSSLDQLAPHAAAVADLKFYFCLSLTVGEDEWLISRTGYTGERGYEIYVPNRAALSLWTEILDRGSTTGARPIGLAARDTLRFEMAYCLYGHELGEDISPLEAGIGWAVKLKKLDFIGKEALQKQKAAGVPRRLIGMEIQGRAIARQSAPVTCEGERIGYVTSGTYSPSLKRSLAMALLHHPLPEGELCVDIRGRQWPCREVACPFLESRVKGDPRAERNLAADS